MKTQTSLRCIIAVLLLAGAASTALGQDLIKLPTGEALDTESAIAVDPTNPCDAVTLWFTRVDTFSTWYSTTRDGWETATVAQEFLDFGQSAGDPSVVYDPFTEVFWGCYLSLGVGVAYAKSAIVADDIVFPAPNQILLEPDPGPLPTIDKPWFGVGRRPGTPDKSNLYMAYSGVAGQFTSSVRSPTSASTRMATTAAGRRRRILVLRASALCPPSAPPSPRSSMFPTGS